MEFFWEEVGGEEMEVVLAVLEGSLEVTGKRWSREQPEKRAWFPVCVCVCGWRDMNIFKSWWEETSGVGRGGLTVS